MFKPSVVRLTALTAISLLSGCGGGSGSPPAAVAPPAQIHATTFPIQAALQNYYSTSQSYSVSGTAVDANGTKSDLVLTYTHAVGEDASFEGIAAKTVQTKIIAKRNNAPAPETTEKLFLRLNPFSYVGRTGASGYGVYSNQGVIPVNIKVGDSGSLGTVTGYVDSTKKTPVGQSTETWTLEADPGSSTTAFWCVTNQASNKTSPDKSIECLKITTTGAVVGHRLNGQVNGFTIALSG